ncbi:uncharacterized protein LOC109805889 [Cajanus cajan]|uniref:uncharacterized protein LOC109805889 n=1 Tax=Cajanus cajan TaxID=3821 RepID=UPI00098D83C6|nr:uncharacterized protein LOC109805889 [Cajanus cajan]
MGYFDLNIPYPQPTDQSNRTRLAVKAMELGYTGIAYNRTIKGVMSDQHRCSIAPLTLTTLLNVLPSLSLSANLHRHLLGVPLSTPFRQYTRLTVCVDSPAQAQALNSANPILKTYDLVAVKPSNQTAFDLACQTMEVDIISIDFSAKLPFRLKHPMVKAATQRGVCFEVTYSGFFADIQIRRQLISSAKLLMDWTRGQNIVFSSAAPTVNELRGPCDVANLLSLFGLSKERANAAISKNCRILLANSLRKKRFYKEAIRVEVLSSDAASNSKEDQYQELLKWDPISSGEGDILLDDVQKSCVDSHKASKTAKAIDFTSLVNSLPSHGFEIKNILPANNALPVCPDNEINFSPVAEKTNQSTPVSNNLTEQLSILDVFPKQDEKSLSDAITRSHIFSCDKIFEKNIRSGTTEAVNLKEINIPTAIDSVSVVESLPSHGNQIKNFLPANSALPVFSSNKPDSLEVCAEQDESSQSPKQSDDLLEKTIHSGTTETFNSMEMDISTNARESEKSFIDSDVDLIPFEAKELDAQSNVCISSNTLDTRKPPENEKLCGSSDDAKLDVAHVEILDITFPAPVHDKHNEKSSNVNLNEHIGNIHNALPNEDLKIAEQTVNTRISDTSMEDKQFDKQETDAVETDEMQQPTSYEMKVEDDSTDATHLFSEVIMKDKKLGEVSTDSDHFASVRSVSGGLRMKRRTRRGLPLFPFKRLLNTMPFKKKGKKSKSRTKLK